MTSDVRNLLKEPTKLTAQAPEEKLDESVEMTFPASDPPAFSGITKLKHGPENQHITSESAPDAERRQGFLNREDAARKLAIRLVGWRGKNPLILAIPRGAVPIAQIIATALDGELDLVLVRKLGAPKNPEYAIGAIDEYGSLEMDPNAAQFFSSDDIHQVIDQETKVLEHRKQTYRTAAAALSSCPTDRTVIVIDDGLATGATMACALRAIAKKTPKRLIAAVPVASKEAILRITSLADQVICLYQPPYLGSVSSFFTDFRQVSDEEVIRILCTARRS